jgi:hypothetical protein
MEDTMDKKIATKRTIGATVLTGLCAYAATVSAMVMNRADAFRTEIPAVACQAAVDTVGSNLQIGGFANWFGTGTISVRCPVPKTTDSDPADPFATLVIYGAEGTNGANSRACSCYPSSLVCNCPAVSNWATGPGIVVGSLNTGEWSGSAVEFRYVVHNLTQNSALAGMTLDAGP